MTKHFALAGLLLAACTAPLAAEEIAAPSVAPPGRSTERFPKPLFGRMTIYAAPVRDGSGTPVDTMRRVMPAPTIYDGFTADNPLVAAYLAQPTSFYAYVEALARADGTITGCRATGQQSPAPFPGEVICAGLEQAVRVMPALDAAGNRVPAPVRISVSTSEQPANSDGSAPGLFADRPIVAPPAPPAAPPRLVMPADRFPPRENWLRTWSAAPTATRVPLAQSAPAGEGVVGVLYGAKGGEGAGCQVIQGSGDPARDAAACAYVEKKLKPAWADSVPPERRHLALLVAPGAAPQAYAAQASVAHQPMLDPAVKGELASRVAALVGPQSGDWSRTFALLLTIAADGSVKRCEIATTSGSDAADIGACRLAQAMARFEPQRDSFGRAEDESWYYWGAIQEGVPVKR